MHLVPSFRLSPRRGEGRPPGQELWRAQKPLAQKPKPLSPPLAKLQRDVALARLELQQLLDWRVHETGQHLHLDGKSG